MTSSIFTGSDNTGFLKTTFGEESGYEHIARILSGYIPQSETDRAMLVGQYEVLQRTAFSSLTGSLEIRPPVAILDKSDVDPSKSWLVTVGDQAVSGFEEPTIVGGGYKMYSLDPSNSLIPRNNTVVSFSNTCETVADSDWACGKETEVILQGGFPSNANVDLIIELSPKASEGEIELVLGGAAISGKLSTGINAVNVKFSNASPVETLLLRSKSSDAVGLNIDSRFVRVLWGLGGK
jgi:hypothetical protein